MLLLLLSCSDPTPVGEDSTRLDTSTEFIPAGPQPTVLINEFMASNEGTITDDSGTSSDWVELYNAGDDAVSLKGWRLVLDEEDLEIEEVTVEPGGFALLWLSDGALGPAYLDGKLPREGASLSLLDPRGLTSDALHYPQQATDVSAARIPDGAEAWSLTATPTPEGSNEGVVPDEEGVGGGGPCVLGAPEQIYYLEGDTIAFPLVCTENPSAELLPVRLPQGSNTEDGFWWASGPADGGRVDLVFASRPAGAVHQIPEATTFRLWVADDASAQDNVPVDPLLYTEEWALPVFHIQTEGSISESYRAAEVIYEGHAYEAQIKVRGASSTSYPKQSYTLAFEEVELEVEDWPETRDRIVLVTTFDDNSYVRQKLIYDQWLAIAEHWGEPRLTPRAWFAVMYLNGAYHGLYTGIDHVDDEFMEHMGFERDGNLYKSVNHDANFYLKSNLHAGYEKKEGVPADDFTDLDALVNFTGGSSTSALIAGAEQWLDLGEFMDWFLLVHYTESADSAGKNAYLYNDPLNLRFRYAPWDFNHSWGQNWYTARVSVNTLSDFSSRNAVFAAIHAERSEQLWDRFRSLRDNDGPMSTAWVETQLDAYYALIEPSAERDWEKWAADYGSFSRWAGTRSSQNDWTDYQAEKEYLYTWVAERGALFDSLH